MPDFVVRNKETGKFLHRGGDCNTPLHRWKADTVDKARIYRTKGAATLSVGEVVHREPKWVIHQYCRSCRCTTVGRYCPDCGTDNRYNANAGAPDRAIPDTVELLELEVKLKPVSR